MLAALGLAPLYPIAGRIEAGNGATRLEAEPTAFVLRGPERPLRRIDVRLLEGGKPQAVAGRLEVRFGGSHSSLNLDPAQFVRGAYALLVPEPDRQTEVRLRLEVTSGASIETACAVAPARKWTFFMTQHHHYDVGFTAPQPVVIEQVCRDMDTVVRFCRQTSDWPAEAQFRWTVEVSGLFREYLLRRTPEQVAKFLDWVKSGRIEVCGFYLNMPTEITGHEELVRCLYFAEDLRRRYGISVETAMIDDVPGYTWSLADLLPQAGIPRVSFRANPRRARFDWSAAGAVPRPFYWQGPAGGRVFVWYTETYRDGNFFRSPGQHEEQFAQIIQRNLAIGYPHDEIQLRMAGDNMPPDVTASSNTRDWNAKYLWPRVKMATNRDFLELLESRHGATTPVFRGDIPSWWADGPASAARENGLLRVARDRLAAAEMLWAAAWLAIPDTDYPRQEIRTAYEQLLYADEHTWGSGQAIRNPDSDEAQVAWRFKAAMVHDARIRVEELHDRALQTLSGDVAPKARRLLRRRSSGLTANANGLYRAAVWNTLAWPRTDVVELDIAGTPLEDTAAVQVVDTRTGDVLPAQLSRDRGMVSFVARDTPPLGFSIFAVGPQTSASGARPAGGTLDNSFYRVTASRSAVGLSSWFDKRLGRELLDPKAEHLGNQAVYEKPLGGREALDDQSKRARFDRFVADKGELVAQTAGPVFQEMSFQTALPTCPRILQTVRLYEQLRWIEISNVVTKEEHYEPEALYFAFPFAVPSPEFRCEIANATMRPGKDQLANSCFDYYAIQHWLDVAGPGFGVTFSPLEAYLVQLSGLQAGRWAPRIEFDKGHVYSWAMNNYWFTNFRPAQGGAIPFRYRLTSYAGPFDPVAATRFGWQQFVPLEAVWLAKDEAPRLQAPVLQLDGASVMLISVKLAEQGDDVIARLLEIAGKPCNCKLRLQAPGGGHIRDAYLADPLENPRRRLEISGDTVGIALRPFELLTIRLAPQNLGKQK